VRVLHDRACDGTPGINSKEDAMKVLALGATLIIGALSLSATAHAAPSGACKQCADQQRACKANYSAKTCKTDYDLCMKGCAKK